jgi:hypothetical protein
VDLGFVRSHRRLEVLRRAAAAVDHDSRPIPAATGVRRRASSGWAGTYSDFHQSSSALGANPSRNDTTAGGSGSDHRTAHTIGTARWLGVPLAALLAEAGVSAQSDQIVARSIDGMTIGTPVATATDGRDTMLVIGMNGEPLPQEHGFPVRMLTPGLYGYVGACKWLIDIELTTFDAYDPYWVTRGWSKQAPVKTASRIDKPCGLAQLTPGAARVAGVAWAQHRGIKAVEVQVDDGPWAPATLLPTATKDTWVQWTYDWPAKKGQHQLRVRATDGTGTTQPEKRVSTFPNGSAAGTPSW